jgi:hypothetical protein
LICNTLSHCFNPIACQANCVGKNCGDDGCLGSCGSCVQGQSCNYSGQCITPGSCQPQCAGKQCGANGCGGSCGSCVAGTSCDYTGHCVDPSTCVPECGEGASVKECGPDGCGSVCGQCAQGQSCDYNGQCVGGSACLPNCFGKECGSDGCGSVCGVCPEGVSCKFDGTCVTGTACTPSCEGKECGSDQCGGTCGDCPEGVSCKFDGTCAAGGCPPNCAGKACGPDGCDGTCGGCSEGFACSPSGQCSSSGCTGVPVTVQGVLQTSAGDVAFDAVTTTITHKPNPGMADDGCINQLLFELRQGAGCQLSVAASGAYDGAGRMAIQEVTLISNSLCDSLPPGTYGRSGKSEGSGVVLGIQALPGVLESSVCFQAAFTIDIEGDLTDVITGDLVALEPAAIVVSGDFISTVNGATACPCAPSCAGNVCNVTDGCNGLCVCVEGEKCSEAGQCVNACTPNCSGKECGSDGCGGVCGECPGDGTCSNGSCLGGGMQAPPTPPGSSSGGKSGCQTSTGTSGGAAPWALLLLGLMVWVSGRRLTGRCAFDE